MDTQYDDYRLKAAGLFDQYIEDGKHILAKNPQDMAKMNPADEFVEKCIRNNKPFNFAAFCRAEQLLKMRMAQCQEYLHDDLISLNISRQIFQAGFLEVTMPAFGNYPAALEAIKAMNNICDEINPDNAQPSLTFATHYMKRLGEGGAMIFLRQPDVDHLLDCPIDFLDEKNRLTIEPISEKMYRNITNFNL